MSMRSCHEEVGDNVVLWYVMTTMTMTDYVYNHLDGLACCQRYCSLTLSSGTTSCRTDRSQRQSHVTMTSDQTLPSPDTHRNTHTHTYIHTDTDIQTLSRTITAKCTHTYAHTETDRERRQIRDSKAANL